MKICSLNDSALKIFAEQPESQDLSQSQKIPWRSEDTLWGRSSCEEFYVSRHQTEQRETCEKTQHSPQVLHQLWTALKRKEHKGVREISAQGNSQASAFPGKCSPPCLAVLLLLQPCWDKFR